MDKLLLCFLKRQFRSAERTTGNILESEDLCLTLRLLDKPAYRLLDKWSKPYQYEGIGHIEEGVKHCDTIKKRVLVKFDCLSIGCSSTVCNSCQLSTCCHRILEAELRHDDADKLHDRSKYTKHPDNSDDIEDGMSSCRSLCRCIGNRSRDISGNCSTDVLSEDHCHCKLEVDKTGSRKKHCYRHCST